jgi:hypothetical protein
MQSSATAAPAGHRTNQTFLRWRRVETGLVGGDAPRLVAGQTDSSPSMAGIVLLMPVNRVGAVEYEIDENNGIKA